MDQEYFGSEEAKKFIATLRNRGITVRLGGDDRTVLIVEPQDKLLPEEQDMLRMDRLNRRVKDTLLQEDAGQR